MDTNQIVKQVGTDIDKFFAASKRLVKFTWQDKVNYLNQLGRSYGFQQLSTDNPDAFGKLKNYLDTKINQQSISESIMKNILKEENLVIQSPKPILNYEDSDAVAAIKDVVDGYNGMKIIDIKSNADQFFNVEIQMDADGEWKDLEAKRYSIAQALHKFRTDFISDLGNKIPVTNINIGAYKFTKNEDKLNFIAVVLVSNTNNKDWVTGKLKKDLNESLLNELTSKKK